MTAKLYSQRRFLKRIILVCPLVLIILFVILKLGFSSTYRNIIEEDSWLENMQAIAYLVASVFSFLVMAGFAQRRRTLHALLFFIFAMALIFICLEEISWGQRILNLPTPEYFKAHNKQSELSFHNLDIVRQSSLIKLYILVGLVGSFGWLMIPKRIKRDERIAIAYLIPDWYLMFYFLPVTAIYSYFDVVSLVASHWHTPDYLSIGHIVIWRDQEPAELLLSFGFLLFVIRNKLRQSLNGVGRGRPGISFDR
jgi:hypothetical protein